MKRIKIYKLLAYMSCMTMLYSLLWSLEDECFVNVLISTLSTTGTFLFGWLEATER